MKFFIIIFILTISTFANCNLKVPSDNSENAKLVVKKGWEVANHSLKKFFKYKGKSFIKSYLECANDPVDSYSKESSPSEIPKIHISQNQNLYALAYAKYLESLGKTEEALKIYINILKGIKQSLSEYIYGVALIYAIVTEKAVTEAILEGLNDNKYNNKEKIEFRKILKENLLLEANLFSKILEVELYDWKRSCQFDLVDNYNAKEFVKEKYKGIVEGKKLDKLANTSKGIMQKVCDKTSEKYSSFYKEISNIKTKKDRVNLESKFKMQKKNYYETLKQFALKKLTENKPKKIEMKIDDKEVEFFVDMISSTLFYEGALIGFSKAKLQMIKNIERNNKLLKLLI